MQVWKFYDVKLEDFPKRKHRRHRPREAIYQPAISYDVSSTPASTSSYCVNAPRIVYYAKSSEQTKDQSEMEHVKSYTYAEYLRDRDAKKPDKKDETASASSSDSSSDSDEDASYSDKEEWSYKPKQDPPKPAPQPIAVNVAPELITQQYYCYPSSYQQAPPQYRYRQYYYPDKPTQMAHPQQYQYAYHPQHSPVPSQGSGPYTYYCYPSGEPVTVVEKKEEPKPKAVEKKAEKKESPKKAKVDKNIWMGRTKAEVDYDNYVIASREGVFRFDEMQPKNAQPGTLFWVVELDNTTTLRQFATITDKSFGPGKWERDDRYGNAYFVREKPKEEEKKK
ncbi:hypothetical protein MBLNU457_g0906t1 [Dothideomycetes sp. NU457]